MDKIPGMVIDQVKLGETGLFSNLPADVLQRLSQEASLQHAGNDAFFFLQGDAARAVYVLVSGRVKIILSSADGDQTLVRAIGPYTIFGAIALTDGAQYPVSAQSIADSVAAWWKKETLTGLIGRYPQLALNALQLMSDHAQEMQERFHQLATERVERRLARTLVRLAGHSGRKTAQGILIDIPLTRQDLAEMTATTLYTVSRILKQWEDRGLVISSREKVTIRQPHAIVSIAEDLLPPL